MYIHVYIFMQRSVVQVKLQANLFLNPIEHILLATVKYDVYYNYGKTKMICGVPTDPLNG